MAREARINSILATKLHRPPVEDNHIHRPRLLERLDQRRGRPLTMVSTPAGYGKSVLISCWIASCESPNVWVSLDENDNDLYTFTAYIVAGFEKLFPGACQNTHALLNAPTLPPVTTLANSLLNELDRIDQSFIIVLDDYYLINESAVHDLIAAILKHPPPSLHLVIVSRRDPPLPITRLRAKSQVTELRTQDLRFTTAETLMFLEGVLEDQIDPSIAASVEEKTEGWVTGLRLAALSIRHRGTLDPRLLEPQVDTQYVMEYLFDEVFSHQPPEINRYLLSTSVLDRFCGPLCEAVCVPGDEPYTCKTGGWEFITWLKKENIFLIRLDDENQWFRYHHLFQRLLVRQLKRHCNAGEIKTIHSQAAGWFFENGLIEEGLRHSLAGGDIPKAMRMVARHGHDLMNDQQWPRLERWIRILPQDHVEQDPELLVLKAWICHIRNDFSQMVVYLQKIESLISKSLSRDSVIAKRIRGHFDALQSFGKYFLSADGKNALVLSKRACESIPPQHKRALAFARLFRAGAYQMVGDLESGLSGLRKAITGAIKRDDSYHNLYLVYQCFLHWINADLVALQQTAERALALEQRQPLPETVSYGFYFIGVNHYFKNELQSAEENLAIVVKDYYAYNTPNFTSSSYILALICIAKGQTEKAEEISKAVINFATDTNNAFIRNSAEAFRAELALRQGQLAIASQWLIKYYAKPFLPPYRFYMPQITAAKILLAKDSTDSRRQAADLLDQLLDFLSSINNIIFQIEVLALQALLNDTLGNGPVAIEKLTKALNLSEQAGIIRIFVDLGPQMAELLNKLMKQNTAVDYIRRILNAFKEDDNRLERSESDHPTVQSPPLSSGPLTDPLTNRELDVLELLVQRLQNKEIAARLFISPETVKKHLSNLYPKLNVSDRRQAIAKAHALDILSHR